MNILLLNHSWFAPELSARGHRVVSAGIFRSHLDVNIEQRAISTQELFDALPVGFAPDRLVAYDDSGIPWLTDLERLEIPKLFYSIDTHHHHGWHARFGALFDHVLVAQKRYLPNLAEHNRRTSWFPPWAPVTIVPESEKSIDVCFRGTLDPKLNPARTIFFDELARLVPGDYGPGSYAEAYPRASIVINQTVADDLNFRVFEALMSGAFLITPESSTGLSELFVIGEDLFTYPDGDSGAAAKLITWALENPAERERIAGNGRGKILAAHTKEHRALELETILSELEITPKPTLHYSAAQSYLFSVLVSEVQQHGTPHKLLLSAGNNLIDSLGASEPVAETESVATTLHLCSKLRHSGASELETALFTALQQKYPQSVLACLGLIDALVHSGDTASAEALAARHDGNTGTLLAQAPRLMEQARQELFGAVEEMSKKDGTQTE